LFDAANPLNPINRRISIIVMNKRTEESVSRDGGTIEVDAKEGEAKVGESNEGETKEGAANEGVTKDGATKDGVAKAAIMKEGESGGQTGAAVTKH
jgi:hypothetical protein